MTEAQIIETEKDLKVGPEFYEYQLLMAATMAQLDETIEYSSSVELGCGSGMLLEFMSREHGNAIGYDQNSLQKERFDSIFPNSKAKYVVKDLRDKRTVFGMPPADLYIAIEVFEHIPDGAIERILKWVKCEYFLFSSTPHTADNDEEWGHINIKQEDEWLDLFNRYGYKLHHKMTAPTKWTLLFKSI